MTKFRWKLPLIAHGIQWSGSNWHSMLDFAGSDRVYTQGAELHFIQENKLEVVVQKGDWILKNSTTNKEFYIVPNEIMEAAYVTEEQN